MPPALDYYHGFDQVRNRYAQAILATWRQASGGRASPTTVPFSKEDLVRHAQEIRTRCNATELDVKNVPDIIYHFRARAELPDEILRHGNYAIVGRGKGLYNFSRIPRPNRFRLPQHDNEVVVQRTIPIWTLPYLGDDEQGMLTSIAHHNLVQRHLNLRQAFRLQSHLRMGVPNYGQVEVDEIYAGETASGEHIIIGVEAKDKSENDLLNVSQLFGTAQALRSTFPNLNKKLVGVKPSYNGDINMCEFTVPSNPSDLRPMGDWVRYHLI